MNDSILKGLRNMIMATLLLALIITTAAAAPDLKLTIAVVDENGTAVTDAVVEMTYLHRKSNWTSTTEVVRGNTNNSGVYEASTQADERVWFSVSKDGYYWSSGEQKFKESKMGRWEPWNPEVHVVLRKIEHPVPMYARNTAASKIKIPVANKAVGFDLIEFDWVAPYGKGKVSDFIFKLQGTYKAWDDYDMTLAMGFANKRNGIQLYEEDRSSGSAFKLPRFAPEMGYASGIQKFNRQIAKGVVRDDFRNSSNYFFRVRSEVEKGKLKRAMYGKIQGDIEFYPKSADTAVIHMKYFLNPDYTRNLEYDPAANLFKDLPPLEWVKIEN